MKLPTESVTPVAQAHPLMASSVGLPTVLVLAAGQGRRFVASGGCGSKLEALLTLRGNTQTVLAHVLTAVQASGLPFYVVRSQDTQNYVLQGMGTSIAAGVTATASSTGWLILPGDLPGIEPQTLRQVAKVLQSGAEAVCPVVNGQRGHPVGFCAKYGARLQHLRGDAGAKQVLKMTDWHALPLQDQGCIWDIDTLADLALNPSV